MIVRERRRPATLGVAVALVGGGETWVEHRSDIALWVCWCSYSGWTTT